MTSQGTFESMHDPTERQARRTLSLIAGFMIDTLAIPQLPETAAAFGKDAPSRFDTVSQSTLALHMAVQGLLTTIQGGLDNGRLPIGIDQSSKIARGASPDGRTTDIPNHVLQVTLPGDITFSSYRGSVKPKGDDARITVHATQIQIPWHRRLRGTAMIENTVRETPQAVSVYDTTSIAYETTTNYPAAMLRILPPEVVKTSRLIEDRFVAGEPLETRVVPAVERVLVLPGDRYSDAIYQLVGIDLPGRNVIAGAIGAARVNFNRAQDDLDRRLQSNQPDLQP